MKIDRVRVPLRDRAYDIRIGEGVLEQFGSLYRTKIKRAILMSDVRLLNHRARALAVLAADGWKVDEIAVEAGESLKDIEQLYEIYGAMVKVGIDRGSSLLALGGGTVGDAAGFVASTYLRGIPWVGLPTTLLAQVDSSVGGKTAVNHPLGKNLIGTFYQPALVVCETSFLKTLAKRELVSGLGEVLKYGLTFDHKFFKFVRENWAPALARDRHVIHRLVTTSVKWKAKWVAKDEFDRRGVREVLNFGHTFAHALETMTNYQKFQHGEAVIWGMRFALALSQQRGHLPMATWLEVDEFLRQVEIPDLPAVEPEEFFKLMRHDKKAREGKVRFVLLKKIGQSVLDDQVEPVDLKNAWNAMIKVNRG